MIHVTSLAVLLMVLMKSISNRIGRPNKHFCHIFYVITIFSSKGGLSKVSFSVYFRLFLYPNNFWFFGYSLSNWCNDSWDNFFSMRTIFFPIFDFFNFYLKLSSGSLVLNKNSSRRESNPDRLDTRRTC